MKRPVVHPLAAAILGFVLAPLVPAILIGIYAVITDSEVTMHDAIIPVMGFYYFAEMLAILIGMPAIFLMRYFWKITLGTTLFAGLFIGLVGGVFLNMALLWTFFCGIYGLFSAYIFWNIWSLRIGHPMQTGTK